MCNSVTRLLVLAAGITALWLGSTRDAAAQSFRRQGRIGARESRQEGRWDAQNYGNYGNYGYNTYGPGGYYNPGYYGSGYYGSGYYGSGGYGPGYGAGGFNYGAGGLSRGGYYGYGPGSNYGTGGGFYGPANGYAGGYGGPGNYNTYGGYGPGYGGPQGAAAPYEEGFASNNPPAAPRPRGYLGVTMSETPDGIVRVSSVRPESPAEEAGLRPGDEILAINDREVYSSRDVTRMIGRHNPGDTVQLDVDRNGRDRNVEVVLGEQNASMQAGGPGQGPMYNEPYGQPGYGAPTYGGPGYGGPTYGSPGYGGANRPMTAQRAVRQRNQALDPNLYDGNPY